MKASECSLELHSYILDLELKLRIVEGERDYWKRRFFEDTRMSSLEDEEKFAKAMGADC